MSVFEIIRNIYFFIAAAFTIYIVTGLLTEDKPGRIAWLKTVAKILLASPVVLYSTCVLLLFIRHIIDFFIAVPGFFMIPGFEYDASFFKIFFTSVMLMPLCTVPLHYARRAAGAAAGAWYLLSIIIASLLTFNLAVNYITNGIQAAVANPLLSYTSNFVFFFCGLLCLAIIGRLLFAGTHNSKALLRHYTVAALFAAVYSLLLGTAAMLLKGTGYLFQWLTSIAAVDTFMEWGIKTLPLLLTGAMNVYVVAKAFRTREISYVIMACLLGITPFLAALYYLLSLGEAAGLIHIVVVFIVNLFALLLLSILLVFKKDSDGKSH
jgi:hypothetical protein